MPRRSQVTAVVENRPGVLASLCNILRRNKINIHGITAPEAKGTTELRFLTDDPEGTRAALQKAGITSYLEEVLVVNIENKPGSLARAVQKLANGGVNIHHLYCTVGDASRNARVVMATSDSKRAEALLAEKRR